MGSNPTATALTGPSGFCLADRFFVSDVEWRVAVLVIQPATEQPSPR